MLLISPLKIPLSRNKTFTLNLNVYRNLHYRSLNKAKINYKRYMIPQIDKLPKLSKVEITYTLYPKTRRKTDIGNIIAVHQKFLEDALVDRGILEDDNYKYVIASHQLFGSIDPINPRVEVLIKEVP